MERWQEDEIWWGGWIREELEERKEYGQNIFHKTDFIKKNIGQVMVAHIFNPSTGECRGRQISEFKASLDYRQDSHGYTEKSCVQKKPNKVKTNKNK